MGDGEWFYERWENGLDSEDVFEYYDDRKSYYWKPELITHNKNKKIVNKEELEKRSIENTTNGYIKVRYHWSEDSTKDERWYQLMCSELSDPRIINQELNLVFVGGQRSILTDEVIQKFSPKETINQIMTPNFANLRIYDQVDPLDWYIIGVDTASERSEKSAFNALQIMKFSNLSQIAEVHHRHGSFLQWADDVEFIFTWLHNQVNDRIILGVEVNTIGKSTFEHLVYDTHRKFNFMRYMYCEDYKNQKFGIYTSGTTKATMVKALLDIIKENPELVKSKFLIDQLSSIERSNSSKTITSPGFTDLFMASCFCAYVKEKKWLDIAPLINKSQSTINQNTFDNIKGVISASNDKKYFTPEIETMAGIPLINVDRDKQKKEKINPDDLSYKELEMFKIINSSYKNDKFESDDPDEKYYNLYREENQMDFFGNITNDD
jgi:hypothetical protein